MHRDPTIMASYEIAAKQWDVTPFQMMLARAIRMLSESLAADLRDGRKSLENCQPECRRLFGELIFEAAKSQR